MNVIETKTKNFNLVLMASDLIVIKAGFVLIPKYT